MPETRQVAVIMACHNRKSKTLQSLQHLTAQTGLEDFALTVYVVDDGSTDGTAEAVCEQFPHVTIVKADGSLFWCRSMRMGMEVAASAKPDFYLWLNDDAFLYPNAVARLLRTYSEVTASGCDSIIVGSCRDPITRQHAYGGQSRLGQHPFHLQHVPPAAIPIACDTFQGNVVLISAHAYSTIGPLDNFSHGMGDTDYGYRAVKKGIKLTIAADYFADCEFNNSPTYHTKEFGRWQRFKLLRSKKGLPLRDWLRFTYRHGGPFWLAYFFSPYIRILIGK